MIALDLRTIIIMSGILGLLPSVVLLSLRLSYPPSIKGLSLWAAGPVFALAATLLLGWRGLIPDAVSIVGANVLLLVGVLFFYWGTQRFFGLAPSYKRWSALIVATIPFLLWYGLIEPNFSVRVMLMTSLWLGLTCLMILLIWRRGDEVFSTRFTVVVLVIHGGVLLLRFLATFIPLPNEGLLDPSRIQSIYITANAFLILALGIGLILMASDKLRDDFEYAASHDSLTHAMMRRSIISLCEQELERCRRHGRSMVLLMLDIDHFKAINDSHGHQMGDRVLVDFVNRITPLLRRSDQLGRFGGEEFVVLLPETSWEEALVVAERICTRVAQPSGDLPPITVSIGMTSNRPDEGRLDVLLARADKALYKAKEAGRNRIDAA